MAQLDTSNFFKKLTAIIALADALGIVHTSDGAAISKIGADVSAVIGGVQAHLTPETAAAVVTLLKDLNVDPRFAGTSIMDDALKVASTASNYLSGQVAVLDSNFNELGKKGHVFAIADDSTNEAAVAFRTAVGLVGLA